MLKYIIAASAVLLSVTANAAEFTVGTYSAGETYIYMNGKTERGDLNRFNTALEDATSRTKTTTEQVCEDKSTGSGMTVRVCEDVTTTTAVTFSKDVYLSGPGGLAQEGLKIAIEVRKLELNTIAWRDCVSACSQIWLGGVSRTIATSVESRVGFHFAYIPNGSRHFTDLKENHGWVGVQDANHASAAHSLALDLYFGIAKPELYVYMMIQATSSNMFWVTNDNLHIIGEFPKDVEFE